MARLGARIARGIKRVFTKIGRIGKKIVTGVGKIGLNIVKKSGGAIGAVIGSMTPVGAVGGQLIGGAAQNLANSIS